MTRCPFDGREDGTRTRYKKSPLRSEGVQDEVESLTREGGTFKRRRNNKVRNRPEKTSVGGRRFGRSKKELKEEVSVLSLTGQYESLDKRFKPEIETQCFVYVAKEITENKRKRQRRDYIRPKDLRLRPISNILIILLSS